MIRPAIRLLIAISACAVLAGCGAGRPSGADVRPVVRSGASAGNTGAAGASTTQSNRSQSDSPASAAPIAYINGTAVTWADLRGPLLEAQGGTILAELVLDRALADRAARQGVNVTDADLRVERDMLRDSLDSDPDQAERLLRELQARRGLGDDRFARLLRRNAIMRALVKPEVEVSDAAMRLEYDLLYGPQFEARIIVLQNATKASQVLFMARDGDDFASLVHHHSSDSSREQGGLLPPISPADPTYPAAVRQALAKLEPGQVSDVIALESGFAILKLERKISARNVQFDDVKGQLAQRVSRDAERMLMSRLARQLLEQANVVSLDPVLGESWKRQRSSLDAE